MKYEVQVIRTIREYAIVEVEADDPRRARAAAILSTKADPELFCDDEVNGAQGRLAIGDQVMQQYKVRFRGNGVSADAWDKAPDHWQWAVFGPCSPFAFGEVVALFAKKEHAEQFAKEMNHKTSQGIDDVLEGLRRAAQRAAKHDFVRDFVRKASPPSLFRLVRSLIKFNVNETVYGWDEYAVDPVALLQGQGKQTDADDVATALAAVFAAAGHECRIVAHAYDPEGERFVNAVVEVKVQDHWFPCDAFTSTDFGVLGKEPTGIRRSGVIECVEEKR